MSISRRLRASADDGFTLAEMLVVTVFIGIVATIAVWGLRAYQSAQEERGTAGDVVSSLRNAGERAQSEGRTYCVSFDNSTTWSVWRYSCQSGFTANPGGSAAKVLSNQRVQGSAVSLTNFSFDAGAANVGTCPSSACVYFYPRGTASGGSLVVRRAGTSTTYTIKVDGMTGRVYLG